MKGHVQHITVCIYIYIIFSAFLQDEKALISSLHSKWVCHMLSIRTLCKPKFYGFGWNSSCMYCTVLCAEELDLGEKELWPTSLSAPVFLPSTKVPCRRRLPDLSDSHGMSWWSLMQRINMDRQHGGENVEFRLPSSLYEFLTHYEIARLNKAIKQTIPGKQGPLRIQTIIEQHLSDPSRNKCTPTCASHSEACFFGHLWVFRQHCYWSKPSNSEPPMVWPPQVLAGLCDWLSLVTILTSNCMGWSWVVMSHPVISNTSNAKPA